VERELGLSSKAQIEEYGVAQFNARCRESVFGYLKEWEEMTERVGFWVDLEHPYITMDNKYIESCWWAIKRMWDKGLIYQGYRVTPHCPRCGTSLSSHEVALGYQDNVEDPSVYIKFKVVPLSLISKKQK
jgi:isoleucyl-tRNA synthetase